MKIIKTIKDFINNNDPSTKQTYRAAFTLILSGIVMPLFVTFCTYIFLDYEMIR